MDQSTCAPNTSWWWTTMWSCTTSAKSGSASAPTPTSNATESSPQASPMLVDQATSEIAIGTKLKSMGYASCRAKGFSTTSSLQKDSGPLRNCQPCSGV